jgi:hypothetical protein
MLGSEMNWSKKQKKPEVFLWKDAGILCLEQDGSNFLTSSLTEYCYLVGFTFELCIFALRCPHPDFAAPG